MDDKGAETPVMRRGFAAGCGPQAAGGHIGLLLVCRSFNRALAVGLARSDNSAE